jgi:hypothetical protein
MRVLRLLDNLDLLIPDTGPSPLQVAELMGHERHRAAGKHKK